MNCLQDVSKSSHMTVLVRHVFVWQGLKPLFFSLEHTSEQMKKYFYTLAISLHQDFNQGSQNLMSIDLQIVQSKIKILKTKPHHHRSELIAPKLHICGPMGCLACRIQQSSATLGIVCDNRWIHQHCTR